MNQLSHGLHLNRVHITHQLFQVLMVGLTIGLTRTVIPALAETEFGVRSEEHTSELQSRRKIVSRHLREKKTS